MRALSLKTLKRIRDTLEFDGLGAPSASRDYLVAEIDRALSPRRGVTAKRKEKATKKETKREETAAIRAEVFARNDGGCEVVNIDTGKTCEMTAEEMDHFFSRRHGQSVETCWAICSGHHFAKTRNLPDAEWWLRSFRAHAHRHGYVEEVLRAENRIAFVSARAGFSDGSEATR